MSSTMSKGMKYVKYIQQPIRSMSSTIARGGGDGSGFQEGSRYIHGISAGIIFCTVNSLYILFSDKNIPQTKSDFLVGRNLCLDLLEPR